jgi:hypothetical protein
MSVAGSRIGLSMKDVDQTTGRDLNGLTPHLRIKPEAEFVEEERQRTSRASTGTKALTVAHESVASPCARTCHSPDLRCTPFRHSVTRLRSHVPTNHECYRGYVAGPLGVVDRG